MQEKEDITSVSQYRNTGGKFKREGEKDAQVACSA